ncbi:MAG: metallophosphoesterase [Candidatus Sulfotelmatobacter sp.]|jgi:calcineurin-like phosphoesterase family protein
MSRLRSFSTGKGIGHRQSHVPPVSAAKLQVQAVGIQLPHYPFQPLPTPNGSPPYRFDLSQLLPATDVNAIANSTLVFHAVGDTGDHRGQQQDFVAEMMTQDAQNLPANRKPAFFYHLGDVVYFAGDISMYGDNFYQTYKDYPCFIVAIPGNHDCQPDDPQDGPVDPNKVPLDGWVQNFMSKNPGQLGSLKTGANRTQLDLPNVYWTFTTPLATIIGLFSNVGETEGEIHQDQIDWFQNELTAANPNLALIVTVHHPPFSGDIEHSGSSAVDQVLMKAFQAVKRYPDLILSGHVHSYQRFTNVVQGPKGQFEIPYVVAGAGGYTKLGKLQKVQGAYPKAPLSVGKGLTLEQYDQDNFGFLRLEVSKTQIVGIYLSAPYSVGGTPAAKAADSFTVDLTKNTVVTESSGSGGGGAGKKPKPEPPKKKG